MKFIKTLMLASFFLGMTSISLKAQDLKDYVIEGKKAKMIVLNSALGSNGGTLSRNEKYVFGTVGENEGGFIYEIASATVVKVIEGAGMVEVLDADNYVTTNYIVRNGKRIEFENEGITDLNLDYGAHSANADLSVISYDTYIGINYVSVIFNGEGKIIDTMRHFDPTLGGGYGSFVFDMSDDGKIMAGRTSARGARSNFSPAIYDRDKKKTFATAFYDSVAGPGSLDGTLYGINHDGSIAVGEINDLPHWIEYNKNSSSETPYVTHQIPTMPGYEMGFGKQIRGNIVAGTDQLDNGSVYERIPWIYNIETEEKTTLHDHLLYRYGLEEEYEEHPYFTIFSMSDNGRIFTGQTFSQSTWCPYIIILDSTQIHPTVRNVMAHQPYGEQFVQIRWEAPLSSDYTPTGYIVYRDSTPIRTINDIATLEYKDELLTDGVHNYQVQAVYSDGEKSEYSPVQRILVVTEGGCLPVQSIDATIVYNRTVKLSWGLPSANIVISSAANPINREPASRIALCEKAQQGSLDMEESKYVLDNQLDYVGIMDAKSMYTSSSVRVGNYLYVGDYEGNVIYIFDALSGNLLRVVRVTGLNGMYDMTYDNNRIFCVKNTPYVTELRINENDPFDISLADSWRAGNRNLTHIAYLKGMGANGEDLILTGGFDEIKFFKTNGSGDSVALDRNFEVSDMIISGSAYYNGRLYFANQHDANSSFVETFDWESGKHLFTTNLLDIPAVANTVAAPAYSALSSGLSVGKLEDGTIVADIMVQPMITYNQLITVEVESAPQVKGYIVYRDGKAISGTLKARHFSEDIIEPGTYTYTVEYLSENDCSRKSDGFVEKDVTINPIGECNPPTALNAYESNEVGCVSWELPVEYTEPRIVGFNVYRNGELVLDKALDLKYHDQTIEKGKESVYVVEAFYENSCVASDTVSLVPTFEGFAAAPSAVVVKDHKDGDSWASTTTWELPYFENPMTLGYCSSLANTGISLDNTNIIYAAIGWLAADGDLEPYKDLYLVGMEFIIGDGAREVNGLVYIDDALVYKQRVGRVKSQEWNQVFFDKSFSMNQKQEVAVGYSVTFDPESLSAGIIGLDFGPAASPGKCDLLSVDGVEYGSLASQGYSFNLLINALVVRKRDLEDAAKSADPKAYIQKKAFVANLPLSVSQSTPLANVPKSTSESYTLQGFNVYRDEVKLNEELLKTFSFEDHGLEFGGEYMYQVSAVYADQEVMSEEVWLSNVANGAAEAVCPIAVQPNPVQDVLYIDGEYATLSIIDMTGRVVLSDVRNAKNISMTNFRTGLYFVRIVLSNGEEYITKIVKQ